MTYSIIRAKTHLRYAQRLLTEAVEAERSRHKKEALQKCSDASEHAFKSIFYITDVDWEKYENLENAVAKGLKKAFDKATLDRFKDCYLALRSYDPEQTLPGDSIEKVSFIIKQAMELIGKE